MNRHRIPSATIAEMVRGGQTARVVRCRASHGCNGETVVDLRSIPADFQDMPENSLCWGCSHCGHPVVDTNAPEYRHAKFKHLTWDELQQARQDAFAATLSAAPVQPKAFMVEGILEPPPARVDRHSAHQAKLKLAFREALKIEIARFPHLKRSAPEDRPKVAHDVGLFADRVFDRYWADLVRAIDPPE